MTLLAVQTSVFDTFGALYAGQMADYGTNTLTRAIRSFRTEAVVQFGRFVSKGTLNQPTDPVTTPYGVAPVEAGDTVAELVGIVILSETSVSNADNDPVTVRAKTMVPVAELGSGAIVGMEVPAGVTIAHGDKVYVSVSDATLPIGAVSNAAGVGRVEVTGAYWYGAAQGGTVGRVCLA